MKDLIEIVEASGDLSLLPCPFCGGHGVVYAKYETPVGDRWRVLCPDCMAGIDPGWAQTRSVVCGLWNRRAGPESEVL